MKTLACLALVCVAQLAVAHPVIAAAEVAKAVSHDSLRAETVGAAGYRQGRVRGRAVHPQVNASRRWMPDVADRLEFLGRRTDDVQARRRHSGAQAETYRHHLPLPPDSESRLETYRGRRPLPTATATATATDRRETRP